MICRFCGADITDDLLHVLKCDGRQGHLEAVEAEFPPHTKARTTDPITSHIAARPDRVTDRARALTALRTAGMEGLTDFELGDRIGRQQTSAGKRRLELCALGLVCNSGQRRPAPSGSPAIVWRITTDEERQRRRTA